MSITDELREYASTRISPNKGVLLAIADRIDERVTELLRKQDADLRAEFDLMNDGWVRLPVDADGVPWYIGDRTESGQTIQAMGLNKHGWHFVGAVNEIDPSIHRHYKPPTVEDVLSEMLDAWGELPSNATNEAIIAEYAAKLRLAEEDA